MKTIYLKKHSIDGQECIVAEDVFNYVNKNTDEGQRAYKTAEFLQDYFNFWNDTPLTLGSKMEFSLFHNLCIQYILTLGLQADETKRKVILKAGNRRVWVIDKIKKPDSFYEAQKVWDEIASGLRERSRLWGE